MALSSTVPVGTALVWHAPGYIHPLVMTLADKGYEVTLACGHDDVLEAAIRNPPDLVLIYLQHSGEAGYELCQILRSLETTNLLPIVLVGHRSDRCELVKSLRYGGSDYIQVPMDEEESWLRLNRYLHPVQVVRRLQTEKVTLNERVSAYDQMIRRQEEIQASLTEENHYLQQLAFVDGLTQVANRRSFNQAIAQLHREAYQSQQPVSLLLCDIDYFKQYNDTYGHPAGDRCLYSVAQAIVRGAHRQRDYVARYGGEEFAVLLPSTDLAGAQQVAQSVQQEIARERILHRTSLVQPQVSLSIGVCTLVPDSPQASHQVLVHGADKALYTAKSRGRNLVVANTYGKLVPIAGLGAKSSAEVTPSRLLTADVQWQNPSRLSA
ncbi:MAG: diguanylate cyclase [Phormidesmis sp.]